MHGGVVGIVLGVIRSACAPSATAMPGPTDDPARASCRADVLHANLNVHDAAALDFAIRDCPSLAAAPTACRLLGGRSI